MPYSIALRQIFQRRMVIIGVLASVLLAGCLPSKPTPASAPQAAASPNLTAIPITEIPPAAVTQSAQAAPIQSSAPVVNLSTTANATASPKADTIKADTKRVATVNAPQTTTPRSTAGTSAPPLVKQPTAVAPDKALPTLNLAALEQRLRDTRAIGAFTKLSLKNQVDDLLDEFQDFYRGKLKTPLTALRQRYDLLMMKVLSLLQDSDSALAASIVSSREAIWSILKDPKQFSQIRPG